MALGATIYTFLVTLNDADRGVYESLEFRVARHPSETPEYLLTRALAWCLEHTEGLEFSRGGLSDPDAPALAVRDLTGALQAWIEVGAAVYTHREVASWLARLVADPPHRAAQIEIFAIDRDLVAALAARLDRRMAFDLSVSEGHLYLTLPDATLDGVVARHRIGEPG
jgi:uncharacterized protein YaeQ